MSLEESVEQKKLSATPQVFKICPSLGKPVGDKSKVCETFPLSQVYSLIGRSQYPSMKQLEKNIWMHYVIIEEIIGFAVLTLLFVTCLTETA